MRNISLIFLILVWILVYIRYEEPQIWNKYFFHQDTSDNSVDSIINPAESAANATNAAPAPTNNSPTPSPAEAPSHLKPVPSPVPPALTPKQSTPDLPRD